MTGLPSSASASPLPIDLDDYDFTLPRESIAQQPTAQRDASKLLVMDRDTGATGPLRHAAFRDLAEFLEAGDLLVLNATRVVPARLRGQRESGGAVEALLLGPLPDSADGRPRYRAILRISKRLRPGIRMRFEAADTSVSAEVLELTEAGERGEVVLGFEPGADPYRVGEPPLPPYIRRPDRLGNAADRERYQTVYARVPGAVAAPTAGLHFCDEVFARLDAKGVERAEVVLHVGPGTFRPLDDDALASGRLHREHYELPESTAKAIAQTHERKGRVVAVGTTSARVLEACALDNGCVAAGSGETDLFLRPGREFRVIDGLITNFHLPRSSLLVLVATFAGRDRTLAAYREAIARGYRFYSYGDAMLIQ